MHNGGVRRQIVGKFKAFVDWVQVKKWFVGLEKQSFLKVRCLIVSRGGSTENSKTLS